MEITDAHRQKLRDIVSHGLVAGVGEPEPGKLCIGAAICMAMGEEHSDQPTCVHPYDTAITALLNDLPWPSKEARADAMLPIGLAQLGTADTADCTYRGNWLARVQRNLAADVVPMLIDKVACDLDMNRSVPSLALLCARAKRFRELNHPNGMLSALGALKETANAASDMSPTPMTHRAARKSRSLSVSVFSLLYEQARLVTCVTSFIRDGVPTLLTTEDEFRRVVNAVHRGY